MVPVTRVNITPPEDEIWPPVWADVNVSAYVDPGNTAGVMLEIINNSTSLSESWGARKNGSTDARCGTLFIKAHTWVAVGIDSNNIFELKINLFDVQVYLVAYIRKDEGAFFTNFIDKSLGVVRTWTDIDISADTGDNTATLAFFLVYGAEVVYAVDRDFGLRENGSTDMLWDAINHYSLQGAFMAVDDNEKLEGYIEHLSRKFYLIGYLTDNFYSPSPNRKDFSTTTITEWVDVDMGDDIPVGEIGAFMYFRGGTEKGGIRKKGTDIENYYEISEAAFPWVELDSDRTVEQKIEGLTLDLYLLGYGPLPSPPVPISPTDLRCEQKTNPTDVTDPKPEFSAIYHGG